MKDFLKTKCMSLAEEIKIIRRLEKFRLDKGRSAKSRLKGSSSDYHYRVFFGLRDHRLGLRPDTRDANIAYGFLKGHEYTSIERTAFSQPNWKRIQTLVEKYGEGDKEERMAKFATWKTAAIMTFEKV